MTHWMHWADVSRILFTTSGNPGKQPLAPTANLGGILQPLELWYFFCFLVWPDTGVVLG